MNEDFCITICVFVQNVQLFLDTMTQSVLNAYLLDKLRPSLILATNTTDTHPFDSEWNS